MTGYVGNRAKRRRRNFFSLIIILIISFLIYWVFSQFDFQESTIIPDENIFPESNEEISSLYSNIEELELMIFQKEQKIKFRDGQINNLKIEISKLKENYDYFYNETNKYKEKYEELLKNTNDKKTDENNTNKINELKNKIIILNQLKKENESIIFELKKELTNIKNEIKLSYNDHNALTKEYKKIISKNIKLTNLIETLEKYIEGQKIEIKKLTDTNHHKR